MVHATVKREPNNSFTVTFGDASSSEDPRVTITNKMSSSPASSKSASTANVVARKEKAIQMAKEAVLYARDAVHAVENTDKFMILSDSENKKTLLQSKNLAYKAASKGITAIVMLRALGLVPEGDEKGGMQEYVTIMIKESKMIRDSNERGAFEKARAAFSRAVDGFESSITTVNSRTANPNIAKSSDSKKAEAAVKMAYEAIEKAKTAMIGYDQTKLYSNNNLGTRITETVIALQNAAEAATEAAAMNDTNTDMTIHSKSMTDHAHLYWITIRMGSDKLLPIIADFKQSTYEFSKAAGIRPSNASGAASATKSTSATSAALGASASVMSNAVISSGTNQLKVDAWKKVVEEVNRDIQIVSTYAEKEPKKALDEAGRLSKKLTAAFKVIDGVLKNEEKQKISAEKRGVTEKINIVFATANRALKKKGGRRTHRNRTHRKRTHRSRTHRNRTRSRK